MIFIQIVLILLVGVTQAAVEVNQITGITANNLMYTGNILVNGSKLFFTFYGMDGETNPDNLSKKPLFLSVGSPGRSAQFINLGGLGPKKLNLDLSLSDNPNKITQIGNAMFLDSLGSGFSFAASLPTDCKSHGSIMTEAINSFINETKIGKSEAIYLIGEATFIRTLQGFDDIHPLKAVVHLSPWFDFYEVGNYYGTAGVQMKIFTNSERISIESTFYQCYNLRLNKKYAEAHKCYEDTLNFIELKTKNQNLFNVKKQNNLTEFLPAVQFYFSQASIVTAYKAPNSSKFDTMSNEVQSTIYANLAQSYQTEYSKYLKDYYSVKQIFIAGDNDFICFKKALRNWLQNKVTFVESAKFKPLNLTEYNVDGNLVGYMKGVDQVAYYQLLDCGHFSYNDKAAVIVNILKNALLLNAPNSQNALQNQ